MTQPNRDALVQKAALFRCRRITHDHHQTNPCVNCIMSIREAIAALEAAGCVVMPSELVREQWAASGNVLAGPSGFRGRELNAHHDAITGAVWIELRDASPFRSRT